jgi:hypothetical protein
VRSERYQTSLLPLVFLPFPIHISHLTSRTHTHTRSVRHVNVDAESGVVVQEADLKEAERVGRAIGCYVTIVVGGGVGDVGQQDCDESELDLAHRRLKNEIASDFEMDTDLARFIERSELDIRRVD